LFLDKKPVAAAGNEASEDEGEFEEEIEQEPVFYDKTKSFFDNISCEARSG
jgi:hypothetical protein